jgi:hypothetical protein
MKYTIVYADASALTTSALSLGEIARIVQQHDSVNNPRVLRVFVFDEKQGAASIYDIHELADLAR